MAIVRAANPVQYNMNGVTSRVEISTRRCC